MSLLELGVGLFASTLVAAASLFLIGMENAALREQNLVASALGFEWNIRSALATTAGTAVSTNIYTSVQAARSADPNGLALNGSVVRMDYTGGIASGSGGEWAATIEIVEDTTTPEADLALEYQNLDASNAPRSRWRLAGQMTNSGFSIQDGMLVFTATVSNRNVRILTCVR